IQEFRPIPLPVFPLGPPGQTDQLIVADISAVFGIAKQHPETGHRRSQSEILRSLPWLGTAVPPDRRPFLALRTVRIFVAQPDCEYFVARCGTGSRPVLVFERDGRGASGPGGYDLVERGHRVT